MPPKAKFTKKEIIDAAIELIRVDGVDALTARALGAKLGSSARPIFTVFQSMEHVRQETDAAARRIYSEYVQQGLSDMPAFKGVGMQYIRFAISEPKLFQLLFMSEKTETPSVMNILPAIDENYPQILASVQNSYGLGEEEAQWLYRHLWIYTHGIGALCATSTCSFTWQEIGKMLTQVCRAMLAEIKTGDAL